MEKVIFVDKNEIKVSVIIPVYNTEKYLRECLDSVLNQTLREIEVICVDDGSTDNSLQILKEYQKKDKRIIIIKQENSGAAVARKKALNIAKGSYIAFMDPDDYYPDRDVLFSLYDIALRRGYFIVGGSLVLNKSQGNGKKNYDVRDERFFDKEEVIKYKDYQYDFYYQRFIYSKDLIDKNNIKFPIYRRGQDVPFFVNIMLAAKSFYAMNRNTYCYRIGHNEIKWNKNEVAIDAIKATIDIIEIAKNNKLLKLLERSVLRLIRYCNEIILINKNIEVLEVVYDSIQKINEYKNDKIKKDKDVLKAKLEFLLKFEKSKLPRKIEKIAGGIKPSKVSVIVPVYNVEKYLPECLDTICNQTLSDLEIICVNDGSTDSSLEILKRYAAIDNRIVILSQTNGGLSVARNTGIKFAKGEYLYFCDSDDKLDVGALETLYNRAQNDNLDMLYFDAEAFFESAEVEKQFASYKTYYKRKNNYQGIYSGKKLFNELLKNKDYFPAAWINFVKTDFILKNNLIFEPGILHEDNLWSFKCALLAERVGYSANTFFHRRVRSNSIVTQQINFNHVYGYFLSAVKGIEFLKFIKLSEDEFKNINNLINGWINNSKDRFSKINDIEKSKMEVLSVYEKTLFTIFILNKNSNNKPVIVNKTIVVNEGIKTKLKKVIPYYKAQGLKNTLYKIKEEVCKVLS